MPTSRAENIKNRLNKEGEFRATDSSRPLINSYKRHKVNAKLQHFSNDCTAILPS